jgi:hypothetical protein
MKARALLLVLLVACGTKSLPPCPDTSGLCTERGICTINGMQCQRVPDVDAGAAGD